MRVRTGIVGCGLIAQVMHLPYLDELHDKYEVVAVCDLSPTARGFATSLFPAATEHERWESLLEEDLDAVFVLTPGNHAQVVLAAAARGVHVFAEKPMCFGAADGEHMIKAAHDAGTVLMVGYMKRYDPAFERLHELLATVAVEDIRLIRFTTLESPLGPYVAHYPLRLARDLPESTRAELERDDRVQVQAAIGEHGELVYRGYRVGLLDSVVHELNVLRGLFGEPDVVRFAHFWQMGEAIEAAMAFGPAECSLAWVQIPGFTRFEQQLSIYAADRRLTLTFPSPFLRNMPTRLVEESGEAGSPGSWRKDHVVSYEEAFRLELIEFHRAIREGNPRTDGIDGARDIALCQAIVQSFVSSAPVTRPTAFSVGTDASR